MIKNIAKYDFKTGLPQEFEIMDLSILYTNAKHILTNTHRSGFYHIIWFQECNVTHLVDFNPLKMEPNSLLFLNKDIIHCFDDKEKVVGKIILFTDNFFCRTAADTDFLRRTILFNDLFSVSQIQTREQTTLFAELFEQMIAELQKPKDNFQADILQNQLHNFLLYSERERRKQDFTEIKKGPDLDYVLLFKEYLDSNYKDQKQVYFYAQQILITEKRLNKATTSILGKTPKEIIDDRVLLEAKRILAHTSESIKEIGYYLGFEEPTNFIKYFKKHVKLTPTEFREQYTLA